MTTALFGTEASTCWVSSVRQKALCGWNRGSWRESWGWWWGEFL